MRLHFLQPHNYRAFSSDPYPEGGYQESQAYLPESLAYLRLKVSRGRTRECQTLYSNIVSRTKKFAKPVYPVHVCTVLHAQADNFSEQGQKQNAGIAGSLCPLWERVFP